MTLLEVTVALAVAGAALAAGAAVLGFLVDQDRRPGMERLAAVHAQRQQLRAWIAEARLPTEGDAEFRGLPRGARAALGGPPPLAGGARVAAEDELTFLTSAPTAVGGAGTIVRLYVSPGDSLGRRGLVAELRPWRSAGTPLQLSIVPEATGLRLGYLASVFGPRVWQPTWVSTSVLPAAVTVRIETSGGERRENVPGVEGALLSLPLVVPVGGRR